MNVVITGASRGIGAVLAENLNADWMYLLYGHDDESMARVNIGRNCSVIKCDVSNKTDVEMAFDMISDVDVLINNAGINIDAPIVEMTEDEWDKVIDVNMKSVFLCTKYTVPKMHYGSHIINISSVVSKIGVTGASNYAASKGGVEALTRSLAKELIGIGIRVNCLSLGYFDIGLGKQLSEKVRQAAIKRIGLKAFGDPMEIVKAVQYIMSSSYLVGSVIELNGGIL
jgi:3-oxoacyl-[acyl-carrier protein] reductase